MSILSRKEVYEFPLKVDIKVRGRTKFDPVIGSHSPFDTNYQGKPVIRLEMTETEKNEFQKLSELVSKLQKVPPFTFRCNSCKSITVITDMILDENAKTHCLECKVTNKDEKFHGMSAKDYTPVKVLKILNSKIEACLKDN